MTTTRQRVENELRKVIVGQEALVEQLLITLFAKGHAVIVGVPGLAKTLIVSSLAKCLKLDFGRIQFTPDLLPSDITGTEVLVEKIVEGRVLRETEFVRGPVFHNILLADEINRTPPKTQAALLEAMQERSVTVAGRTHALPEPFMTLATRNPIEQEGTYPLPEAQLDRFLLELAVDYPSLEEEKEIAKLTTSPSGVQPEPVLSAPEIHELQEFVRRIPITEVALDAAVNLVRSTRPGKEARASVNEYVRFGAGPRGVQAVVLAAKVLAGLRGNAAADLDEVRAVSQPALRHRMVLNYRAEAEGVETSALVQELIQ